MASVIGHEERRITCYILRTTCPTQSNYGWFRGNEAQASFVRQPYVHELVYVAVGLNDLYPPDQVEEALVRFCKLKSIHPDEVTALKKLSKWPKPSLDVLTTILKQYESFQTADAK